MLERQLNALMAIIIACVIFGALGIQFFMHETPCSLCLMQRLGMIGVAIGALLNVRFGPRKSHYGLSMLSAVFGGFVALRQIALHVCPSFPTFGVPFWGLSLYTWSFIVFASSIAYIALLLLFFDRHHNLVTEQSSHWWGRLAFFLVFAVAFINIFSTFYQCGIGAC